MTPALVFDPDLPSRPPARERARPQTILLLPSLREEIERRRGKLSRSAWIEAAIRRQLAAEDEALRR